jgi:outer membrane murein-binding lipoprotein Lpp
MRKTRLLLFCMVVAIVIVVAGCSDTSDQSSDNASSNRGKPASKEDKQKPKTVVVNKGMSKKEEKKLNKRLDKLEKKVRAQDKKGSQGTGGQPTKSGQPEQSQSPQAEEQARAAAEAYYQAVAARNWDYTYNHLDSQTQSAYTEQEWAAKNEYLANTGAVTYTIQSVVMDSSAPETLADVTVVLTATDGSTNVRNTYFVYEDGAWLHRFSPEEYDLLASAPTATASATSSASASGSATASSSPTASPNPSPKPSPNRNDNANRNNNAQRREAVGNARPSGGGGGRCPQGAHWVGIDGPGDGDSDGCAGE